MRLLLIIVVCKSVSRKENNKAGVVTKQKETMYQSKLRRNLKGAPEVLRVELVHIVVVVFVVVIVVVERMVGMRRKREFGRASEGLLFSLSGAMGEDEGGEGLVSLLAE